MNNNSVSLHLDKAVQTSCAVVVAILIVTASMATAGNTVDLTGTWNIDPELSHPVRHLNLPNPFRKNSDRPRLHPREADPGIGWPRGKGPDGRPTSPDELSIKRYLAAPNRYLTLGIVQTAKQVQITRKFSPPNWKEQTVIQTFDPDGSQTRNPVLMGTAEFLDYSKWDKDKLVILGKQVDRGAETIVREEYSLSKDSKRLIVRTSSYYRANKINDDPGSFKRDDPRWDATLKQVFNRK